MKDLEPTRTVKIVPWGERTLELVSKAPRSHLPQGPSPFAEGVDLGDRYRLRRLVAEGGMGRVWLADDLVEQRPVAVKELAAFEPGLDSTRAGRLLQQFRDEFLAMKRLQHPGTVRVYDCGLLETGHRYLVMEYVTGRDLSDLLKEGPLPARRAGEILMALARVLAFIHARLYVHCDIKPSNIRLTDSGDVKLLDFGIMHQLGTPTGGLVLGTLGYIAPEWLEGGVIDARADLFSVGVLAYNLLTAKHPFSRDPARALSPLQPPPSPPSTYADLSPEADAIVMRLLARAPRNRFGSAGDLMTALADALDLTVPAEPIDARESYLSVPEVVGRQAQMAELDARLVSLPRGDARSLFIAAPAGVGKSRMLAELDLLAAGRELGRARGQCRAEGLAPLAPIQQVLGGLARLSLERGGPPPPAALVHLLEEEGTPPGRAELYGALAAWLPELAYVCPFLIVVEDLHWADAASVDLMNVMIRSLDGARGILVGTFRSDEVDAFSPVRQTCDEGVCDLMSLPPLSAADVGELLGLVLRGFALPKGFAEALARSTRGNIFFVMESLRALIEEGALRLTGGAWRADERLADRELWPSIEAVVLSRLHSLPPEQLAFFERVAPAGRTLEPVILGEVTGLDEEALFAALQQGIELQFLQRSAGRYFFTHDTVREAVYEGTALAERQTHHGRIAEALVRRASGIPASARAIGYHFARSDQPREAIAPLLAAGQHAESQGALVDGTLLYQQAAELLETFEGYSQHQALLPSTWGKLVELGYASHPPLCVEAADKLFAWWEDHYDLPAGVADVRRAFTAAAALTGGARIEAFRELLRHRPIDPAMNDVDVVLKRAAYRMFYGIACAVTGETDRLLRALSDIEAEAIPSSPYRAVSRVALATLAVHTGVTESIIEEQTASMRFVVDLCEELGELAPDLAWGAGIGPYMVNALRGVGGFALDERLLRATEIGRRAHRDDIVLFHVFSRLFRSAVTGVASVHNGLLDDVRARMRHLGNPRLMDRNLCILTPMFYLEREEVGLASSLAERTEELTALLRGDKRLAVYAAVNRACVHVLQDQDNAGELCADAARLADEIGLRVLTHLQVYASRWHLRRGDVKGAKQWAAEALARALDPARKLPFDEVLARRAIASVVEHDEAIGHLERALELADAHGLVLQRGLVHVARVEVLGERDHLDAARSAFEEAGATHLLARLPS